MNSNIIEILGYNIIINVLSLNTGQHTKYPANDDGTSFRPCDIYDPRKRYWYIHLTEQEGITYRFFRNFKTTNQNDLIDYWIDRFRVDCDGVENNVQKQCFVEEYDCFDPVKNDSMIENIFIDCPVNYNFGNKFNFIEVEDGNRTSVRIDMNENVFAEDVNDQDFEFVYQEMKKKIARTKTSDAFSYSQENPKFCITLTVRLTVLAFRSQVLDIAKPYMDFSGSGEIISFGKPILDSNNQLLGAIMIDSAVLTNKKRIGPYFNSEFFDGRFKSYMIIIDFEKDLVISHPEKRTENGLIDKRIASYFTTSEEWSMIEDLYDQGFVKN